MDTTLAICAAIAGVIIAKAAQQAGALDTFYDPEDQTGTVLDFVPDFEDLTNYASDAMNYVDQDQAARNEAALLYAIRMAEGTAPDEGYRALFGWRPGNGKTFASYDTHPKQFFNYTDRANNTIRTSAAGAYQITWTTFDALCRKYPEFAGRDFSPATQDAMALTLIKERGALADVRAGRFETAIRKIRPVWASLPGAGVNQPERSLAYVTQAYINAGGVLA